VGAPSAGAVVLVHFPFSDLSRSKLRPAVVLADVGRGDLLLCQITSKPYSDPLAITLGDAAFMSGTLRVTSYARPGKLFTANTNIIASEVAVLKPEVRGQVVDALVRLLRAGTTTPSQS
jgi:mRNA interferase MazF